MGAVAGPCRVVVNRATSDRPLDRVAVRTIYESSFPPGERLLFESVFERERGQVIWLATLEGRTVAFAVILALPNTRAALLEYVAVDAPCRSRGIGRHMLDVIVTELSEGPIERVVLEVEDPSSAPDGAVAGRRLEFYRRWGAMPLRGLGRYFMPDCTDPGRSLPMILLDRPLSDEVTPLDTDGVRALLCSIAEHEYGLRPDATVVADLLAEVL